MSTTQTLAPELMTITEAAKLLGVHPNTIRNRVKAGTMPATKVLTSKAEAYAIPRKHVIPSQPDLQNGLQSCEGNRDPNSLLASFNDPQNEAIGTLPMDNNSPYQGDSQQLTTLLQQLMAPLIETTAHQADELRRVEALYREQIAAKNELITELRNQCTIAQKNAAAFAPAPQISPQPPMIERPPQPRTLGGKLLTSLGRRLG